MKTDGAKDRGAPRFARPPSRLRSGDKRQRMWRFGAQAGGRRLTFCMCNGYFEREVQRLSPAATKGVRKACTVLSKLSGADVERAGLMALVPFGIKPPAATEPYWNRVATEGRLFLDGEAVGDVSPSRPVYVAVALPVGGPGAVGSGAAHASPADRLPAPAEAQKALKEALPDRE